MQDTRRIPGYVARNLEFYLQKEAQGDEEASQVILEISNRWGI
jgi:hypothetical protein